MILQLLPQALTVCKVAQPEALAPDVPFYFAARTEGELSLVCATAQVPPYTLAREDGFRALRVAGSMAFSLVGILAGLTGALAAAAVPVFAVSTFDTDYLLVKVERLPEALRALREAGYAVEEA